MRERANCRLDSSRKVVGLWRRFRIGTTGIGLLLAGLPAYASEAQTPWECSNYTGDAHTRCVEVFVEMERDQIAALQGKIKAQQETVNQLKGQLDRQTSTNARLAQPPAVARAVPPFYSYPSVGFGLSLGSPWIYGSPYYSYNPSFFYGPRYYGLGYWSHRW